VLLALRRTKRAAHQKEEKGGDMGYMKTALLAAVILMVALCSGATGQGFDPTTAPVFDKGPPVDLYGLSCLGDEIFGDSWGFTVSSLQFSNFDWIQARIAPVPAIDETWEPGKGLKDFKNFWGGDVPWALAYESGDHTIVAASGDPRKYLRFGMMFTDKPPKDHWFLVNYQAYLGGVRTSNYDLWIMPKLCGYCWKLDCGSWEQNSPVPEPWTIVSACALVAPAGLLFRSRRTA